MRTPSFVLLIAAILFSVSCKQSDNPSAPKPPEVQWTYGQTATYSIASAMAVNVHDSITGLDFRIPSGGNGVLTIRTITGGPAAPFGGTRFTVAYSGIDRVQVVLTHAADDETFLYGYGPLNAMVNDTVPIPLRWVSLLAVDTSVGSLSFDLPLRDTSALGARPVSGTPGTLGWGGVSTYTAVVLNPGAATWPIATLRTAVATVVQTWLDTLPSSLAPAARAAVAGSHKYSLTFARAGDGGCWYQGNYSVLGLLKARCKMSLSADATLRSAAHEVGHYMNHVLVGNTKFQAIANSLPDQHGIGMLQAGRVYSGEDYAFFSEFFMTGQCGGGLNPESVLGMFGSPAVNPEVVDVPSLEGFGTMMLAALHRTSTKIPDFFTKGHTSQVPVIGLSFADIAEIIAKGAVSTEQLRQEITAYLQPLGKAGMLAAAFEPLGWSYNALGLVIDSNGNAVQDVCIASVTYAGGQEYITMQSTPTGDDGRFYLPRIYPDKSLLRVYIGNDTIDLPQTFPWTTATNSAYNLTLVIPALGIKSILPTAGGVGTNITITGTRFGSVRGAKTVTFNGAPATAYPKWTNDTIVATVPAAATTGTIVVHDNARQSNGVPFTVLETNEVSLTFPYTDAQDPTGGIHGNATLTVNGTNVDATPGSSGVAAGVNITRGTEATINLTLTAVIDEMVKRKNAADGSYSIIYEDPPYFGSLSDPDRVRKIGGDFPVTTSSVGGSNTITVTIPSWGQMLSLDFGVFNTCTMENYSKKDSLISRVAGVSSHVNWAVSVSVYPK
jgi:hypothetical protein